MAGSRLFVNFTQWNFRLTLITHLATHYHFIREIPFLARYQIRLSIGAWDQKWVSFQRFCMQII